MSLGWFNCTEPSLSTFLQGKQERILSVFSSLFSSLVMATYAVESWICQRSALREDDGSAILPQSSSLSRLQWRSTDRWRLQERRAAGASAVSRLTQAVAPSIARGSAENSSGPDCSSSSSSSYCSRTSRLCTRRPSITHTRHASLVRARVVKWLRIYTSYMRMRSSILRFGLMQKMVDMYIRVKGLSIDAAVSNKPPLINF